MPFCWLACVELPLQRAKGGMEPRLVFPEVQDLGHLRFGVAAGAGIGHRQRGGNAVRGEEEIARAVPELGVEVAGEVGVAVHQCLGLAGLGCLSP